MRKEDQAKQGNRLHALRAQAAKYASLAYWTTWIKTRWPDLLGWVATGLALYLQLTALAVLGAAVMLACYLLLLFAMVIFSLCLLVVFLPLSLLMGGNDAAIPLAVLLSMGMTWVAMKDLMFPGDDGACHHCGKPHFHKRKKYFL